VILNMTEGNIFHGALTLDRLYANRPTSGNLFISYKIKKGYNSYQTPIKGLFICGSAAHPGGGVMGSPGRNCANFILDFVL
jgi:phytoene dehydrogenase-like protein